MNVTPITYALTGKGKRAELSYHPMSDNFVPSVWDCADAGPLTMSEANSVLTSHGTGKGKCGSDCRISRTARKVRALQIDAPTVRALVAL